MSKENTRQLKQAIFDTKRTREIRNQSGQFATPFTLASSIAEDLLSRSGTNVSILEPACGSGAFISALKAQSSDIRITGIEKDDALAEIAHTLWTSKKCEIIHSDFFEYALEHSQLFDAVIANPPYTRHQHLSRSEKSFYGKVVTNFSGIHLSGLAGLHAYFFLTAMGMIKDGGIGSWLLPSELFSVNYGAPIRSFLTNDVTLERIHFFDPSNLQFDDALVTSCVVVVNKSHPKRNSSATFSFGDFRKPRKTINIPLSELDNLQQWQHLENYQVNKTNRGTVLGDYFQVKRGLATGGNNYFIKPYSFWQELHIPDRFLSSILPPPRDFAGQLFTADTDGWLDQSDRILLTIPKTEPYSSLPVQVRSYLDRCPSKVRNGYIVRHREPWYSIQSFSSAPIVCTYMSRSDVHPFRFIRNCSNATMTNSYLGLYPRKRLNSTQLNMICEKLNSLPPNTFILNGREYGGGLKKIEPKELMAVPVNFDTDSAERLKM